jgi:alkylation response protein AidB-like acyl-CoA dehydrogenase
MNFDFDDDQELLRTATRSFLDKRSTIEHRRPLLEADEVFDRTVWQEGAQLGWTAMLAPERHDGGSVTTQPLVDLVVLAEEFGRTLQPGPLVPTNVVADAIARSATEEQRATHLPGIVSGRLVAAWCASADGTVEPASVGVRATRTTDGGVILRGTSSYVHGATVADLFLVAASTPEGLVQVLVPCGAAGVSVRRLHTLDLTRRFGEVHFDDVTLAAPAALASSDTAAVALHARAVAVATVLQAAEAVGAAEQLFATTLQYSKDRVQFGRAIGSFQAIKHRMANLAVALEGMRAAAHYAALALNDGFADAAEAVATAGAYVTETHSFLCGECLQLTGGIGFTWEHDLHLFLRRARTDEVLYGDPSWHRERLCELVASGTTAGEND